jgi:ankyrin repeat protein
VFCEDLEMIKLLLKLGADPEKRDGFFGTPFDYAKLMGRVEFTS